ncbi:MAG: zinc ribbon domain-containing protein [Propionibacteriales bacterium]|nr:zinc ribbon domain-containing protein [Propionibacteriales bacterium]
MPYCSHCGAASATPDQRFCQACGKPLDAAAAASAAPAAPTAPEEIDYQYLGAPTAPTDQPGGGGRRLAKVLGATAVVAALAGGAFLAYTVFFDRAGAGTPEDAVTQMLQAVADQDGVEALRMLNPGETEGFDDVYDSLQKKVADAGLASDADGKVLEAVSIKLTDLKVDVSERGENAARVYIKDGTLAVTVDEDKLPETYRNLYDEMDSDARDQLRSIDISEVLQDGFGSDDKVFLTTIKQDGRWFVSPIATAGEYILESEELDPLTAADFDKVSEENAPKPRTSKDPQGALAVLVEAISTDSVENIFAALPADEVAALRPFTDVLQDQLDGTNGTDLQVSDLDTDFKDLGDDRGRLTIKHGKLSGTIDGEEGYATLDGTCVESSDSPQDEGDSGTTNDCIPDEVKDQTGIDSIWVILHQADGGWQVDPRATVIEYATRAIDNFDLDAFKDSFSQGFSDGFEEGSSYYEGGIEIDPDTYPGSSPSARAGG